MAGSQAQQRKQERFRCTLADVQAYMNERARSAEVITDVVGDRRVVLRNPPCLGCGGPVDDGFMLATAHEEIWVRDGLDPAQVRALIGVVVFDTCGCEIEVVGPLTVRPAVSGVYPQRLRGA